MLEKVSRKHFMESMDGKRVSIIASRIVNKEILEKALKSIENVDTYHKVTNTPIDDYYTGVFHKRSHGFYRVKANGDKSYKEFVNGDYILSDDTLSFIITPSTMRVCVYRVEK